MFDEVCQQFRSKWLDEHAMADADGVQALDVADGHQADCKACNGWVRSTKQQIGLLLDLPVLEEGDLQDSTLRENFIARVRAYHRLPQRPPPKAADR